MTHQMVPVSASSPSGESLQTRYEAKVAADLHRLNDEHQRITNQISNLTAQLTILERDRAMLRTLQTAINSNSAQQPTAQVRQTAPDTPAAPSQATADSVNGTVAAPATTEHDTAADTQRGKAAGKDTEGTAAATTGGKARSKKDASLVDRVGDYLARHTEPKSAAEVAEALSTTSQPITASQARVALEGLVRKATAERSRQGNSVYYGATTAATGPAGDTPPAREATDATEVPQAADSTTKPKEASSAAAEDFLSAEQVLAALKELDSRQTVRAIAERLRGEGAGGAVANRVRTAVNRLVTKGLVTKSTVDGSVVFEARRR